MVDNIFKEYGKNPVALFHKWHAEAEKSEINDPNAMALATVDKEGRPEVRMVLLKSADEQGFTFYTNLESAKAEALGVHPYAALNFHWKSLEKQIRISGPVVKTTDEENDKYFTSRSRASRLGAWASSQSRPCGSYSEFEKLVAKAEKKFAGQDVPRPKHWGGFRVMPERMEFWIGHPDRLHKRFVYVKDDNEWTACWLFP
ncbi:MAG: pyridoxamine 5'-phosphate oxidase [Alphaproteobacteria bacterium PRO2]|nr:pyridoxamine 5'-phosphate oxidase [Alphaproteobacteria bacterium PRO2]